MVGSALRRNFVILTAGQFLTRLLSLMVTVYLSRLLSAEGFGTIVLATNCVLYAALLVDIGIDSVGPIEVARATSAPGRLVRTLVTLRLLLIGLAWAGLAIFGLTMPLTELTRLVLIVYSLTLVPTAFSLTWFYWGSDRMGPTALAELIGQLIYSLGVWWLVAGPQHLLWVPLCFTAGRIVAALYLVIDYRRFRPWPGFGLDWELLRPLLRQLLPAAGASGVAMLLSNFDLILLGLWLGPAAAGIYGAAYQIVWLPTMVLIAYLTSFRPVLTQAVAAGLSSGGASSEAAVALLARSLRLTMALAIGLVTGGVVLAEPIIELLFTNEYREAVMPFRFLLISLVCIVISRQFRLWLAIFGRQMTSLVMIIVAALANILLILLLLPRYGLAGTAAATFGAELMMLGIGAITLRSSIAPTVWLSLFWRPGLAALVMAGMVVMLAEWALFGKIIVGAIIYGIMLRLLGVVRRDEVRGVFTR